LKWAGVVARDGAKHSLVAAGAAYIVSHPPMAADREARLAIKAAVSIVASGCRSLLLEVFRIRAPPPASIYIYILQ